MRDFNSKWNLARIVKYLDQTYPDVGVESPFFAFQVILFAAAVLQTTDVDELSDFTHCSRNVVDAVALNMRINKLWVGGKYDCSRWLTNGEVTDSDRFCHEAQVAEGNLFYVVSKEGESGNPYLFWDEQDCSNIFERLACGARLKGASRGGYIM